MRKTFGCIVAAATLTLSACGAAPEPVLIAADPSDTEQMVLAEIYRQIAELDGRQVGLIGASLPDDGTKLALLETREANLAVMCIGSLVVAENPQEREVLAELKRKNEGADSNNVDVDLATYDAAVGTLPTDLATIDPSPAEGCAGMEHDGLPQHIIPVFEKGLFNRGVRQAMQKATRALNTEELEELVAEAQQDGDPSRAVNEWLRAKTGMGAALKRLIDDDTAPVAPQP